MPGIKEQIAKIREFFGKDLWEPDQLERSGLRRLLVKSSQVISLVARDFFADRCLLRASALTYASVLAIVPLLALMFALLKGLGVQNQLEPIILERIAVGSEEIVLQIINYIDNTNVGRLGVVGLAALFLTVLALLSNIEKSFNEVWGVRETRSLYRRFADYFSVVTIGPILIILAISMTSTLQSARFMLVLQEMDYVGDLIIFLFKILPFLGMWIAFTALYIFMPNTRVRVRSALVGGIIGGSLWQLAQWGYVDFQVGVSKYNAIYGTMAALPIFMVWIYLSWLIVLLGLEVSYAVQNLSSLRQEVRETDFSFASRQVVALGVTLVLAEVFYRGERPWTIEQIIGRLQLPPRLVRTTLNQLMRLGIVSEVNEENGEELAYQPGRAPQSLKIYDLFQCLRKDGGDVPDFGSVAEHRLAAEIDDLMTGGEQRALEGMTLHDLVEKLLAGDGPDAGDGEKKIR